MNKIVRNWIICGTALGALCVWTVAACGRAARPSSTSSVAMRAAGTSGQSGITENAITLNALLANALSVNPRASRLLVQLPLNTATYSDPGSYLSRQLLDEYARQFMEYLVSCALQPVQTVSWAPPGAPTSAVEWRGQLGLCPQWHTQGVEGDTACQELVSACLLARNNAFGKAVPISLRGFDTQGHYFGNQSLVPGTGQAEHEVFPAREGAYYGNIFNTEYLDPTLWVSVRGERPGEFSLVYDYETATGRKEAVVRRWSAGPQELTGAAALQERARAHDEFMTKADIESGTVYRDMYACWAPEWSQGSAYFHARICAGPTNDERCAARAVGSCGRRLDGAAPATPQRLCIREHRPDVGYFDFDDCRGGRASSRPSWRFPVTVFLRDPCAIVSDQAMCDRFATDGRP